MTPGRSSTAPTIASAYSDHPADASFAGSETATTSWPRASSSPDTRCQYQASPPAPGTSTYVVFEMRAPLTRDRTETRCHAHRGGAASSVSGSDPALTPSCSIARVRVAHIASLTALEHIVTAAGPIEQIVADPTLEEIVSRTIDERVVLR